MKIYSTALKLVTTTTAAFGICAEVVHGHDVITLWQNATTTSLPPRSLRRRKPLAFRDMAANTNLADPSFDKREQNAPAITTATSRHLQNVWVKLGDDINGEADYNYSGHQLALSNDGTIVAIGADGNDGNGRNSGHVRVLQLVEGSWERMGEDIDGEAAGDYSGYGLDLSADGSIVAIGADFNDGNGDASGHVRIYKYDGSSWNTLGGDLDGEAACDSSGASVSLSADGSIVAIGADYNNDNGEWSGHVRIYQFDGTSSSWGQVGGDLDGEAADDTFGSSIDLSDDGSIVAIGAPRNDTNKSGHVRIYKYDGTSWNKVGGDLNGEAANDGFGTSVSLSGDGSIVAIGGRYNDSVNGVNSGHVRIYKFDGTASWDRVGGDLDGENAYDNFGTSIDLSSDGTIVAVGAPLNDANGFCSGHVRVFERPPDPTVSPTNAPTIIPSAEPSTSPSAAPSTSPSSVSSTSPSDQPTKLPSYRLR
mmetsp:Transcript_2654/g.4733  ORF Transcript_2654/g.4733 Transcript_2654/m.4733 type:complete len:478 (-) Transcript_2654:8-1441(-)